MPKQNSVMQNQPAYLNPNPFDIYPQQQQTGYYNGPLRPIE